MIQIKNLHKKYGGVTVHEKFSHIFKKGTLTVISGPSGIGKTTLLRCITGLEEYEGDIQVDGKISYLFQEDRLMPWLNVEDNMLLPLKLEGKKITPSDREKLTELAQFFKVEAHMGKRLSEVSGGEKQRLLMVRALLTDPDILLLDEPFKSLDKELYTDIYKKFRDFCSKSNLTVVFVTHHYDLIQDTDFSQKMD